jgi:hypothetical protein
MNEKIENYKGTKIAVNSIYDLFKSIYRRIFEAEAIASMIIMSIPFLEKDISEFKNDNDILSDAEFGNVEDKIDRLVKNKEMIQGLSNSLKVLMGYCIILIKNLKLDTEIYDTDSESETQQKGKGIQTDG